MSNFKQWGLLFSFSPSFLNRRCPQWPKEISTWGEPAAPRTWRWGWWRRRSPQLAWRHLQTRSSQRIRVSPLLAAASAAVVHAATASQQEIARYCFFFSSLHNPVCPFMTHYLQLLLSSRQQRSCERENGDRNSRSQQMSSPLATWVSAWNTPLGTDITHKQISLGWDNCWNVSPSRHCFRMSRTKSCLIRSCQKCKNRFFFNQSWSKNIPFGL